VGHDIAPIDCIHSTTTNQLFDNFGYVRAIYKSMMEMLLFERRIKRDFNVLNETTKH
jgi:hypothetical protein